MIGQKQKRCHDQRRERSRDAIRSLLLLLLLMLLRQSPRLQLADLRYFKEERSKGDRERGGKRQTGESVGLDTRTLLPFFSCCW